MASVFALCAVMLTAPSAQIVIVGGQSLSFYSTSGGVSTEQTLGNTMPSGMLFDTAGVYSPTRMITVPPHGGIPTALVESTYESPKSGLANYYATVAGTSVHVVHNTCDGQAYSVIKSGTEPFRMMTRAIESAGARLGASCLAAYMAHGEADSQLGTTRVQYAANLVEWQTDIKSVCRLRARGGDVPLYIDQPGSWTSSFFAVHAATSVIPVAIYDAARANFGRVLIVGPKYYLSHGDGVHLTPAESRRAGAQAGKAIAYGSTWQPLWPRLSSPVERTTNVITVYLYTPVPPLVVDTTNVTGVSTTTRGFEYTDDSSPPSITAVDCSAACSGNTCSCQITLSGTPTGANKKLRYAYTGTDGNHGGPTTGPRGNIRDSDAATWQGAALYNWLVHFEEAVP